MVFSPVRIEVENFELASKTRTGQYSTRRFGDGIVNMYRFGRRREQSSNPDNMAGATIRVDTFVLKMNSLLVDTSSIT